MNKNSTIPVMHCFDNNYVIPAAVSFYSMLKYANKEFYYKLFVLHSDITTQNQKLLEGVVSKFSNASLEFINMENRFEDIWSNLRFSGHYSKEVLYKLLVASIFPQYEKLIITDVDVLFQGIFRRASLRLTRNRQSALQVCIKFPLEGLSWKNIMKVTKMILVMM